VILIKVDIIPTLKERLASPAQKHVLESEVTGNREKLKYYQFEPMPSEKKDK